MSIYEYDVKKMDESSESLKKYEGKVILIVNTASKCGFTKQFEGLEALYKKHKEEDFVILGFPCNQFLMQDPHSNEKILDFCRVNYGVTFPMFAKIKVKGKDQDPLFTFLVDETGGKKIEWNFAKFLIDKNGVVRKRYAPKVEPRLIEDDIIKLIKE